MGDRLGVVLRRRKVGESIDERGAGQIVADADLFIGAIALSRGATIVTGNRKHYERIPGLVVEDWLRS